MNVTWYLHISMTHGKKIRGSTHSTEKNIGRYILIYKHKYIYYIYVYQCLNESESKTFSKRGEDDAHLINTQGEDKTSHKSRNRGWTSADRSTKATLMRTVPRSI